MLRMNLVPNGNFRVNRPLIVLCDVFSRVYKFQEAMKTTEMQGINKQEMSPFNACRPFRAWLVAGLTFLLIIGVCPLGFGQSLSKKNKYRKEQRVSLNPQSHGGGILTGQVIDEEFGEPLVRAIITFRGTPIFAYTDMQGNFRIKLDANYYMMEINHPGYFGESFNVSVYDGITTPVGTIKLAANAVNRTKQRSLSVIENMKHPPYRLSNFIPLETSERVGDQEFYEQFQSVPSSSFFSYGGGYGDSQIGFRGNEADQTSVALDGIILNNPENGLISSNLQQSLADWVGQAQITLGQSATMQSITASGGFMNLLSVPPTQKGGFSVLASMGNDGYMKTSVTINPGLSKNGFASSFQFSRTAGDGLADNTDFEQYGFRLNLQKEFNHRHTLSFVAMGNTQQHDTRFAADPVASYIQYGPKYNSQWGYQTDKPYSFSTNFGYAPLVSLTHYWHARVKTRLTTQLFALMNRQGQLYPGGGFNGFPFDSVKRDANGLYPLDQLVSWNIGEEIAELGSARLPDENGSYFNSQTEGFTTMVAVTDALQIGGRSILAHNFSKLLKASVGVDYQNYRANHFGAVADLLGADGYHSYSDINRPDGYSVTSWLAPDLFAHFGSADKADYYYEAAIQSAGLSLRMDYLKTGFNWFAEGATSLRTNQRIDHFNYISNGLLRKSDQVNQVGGRVQMGMSSRLGKHHEVRLRASYGSYQPHFNAIFPSGDNWQNPQAKNEQVSVAELGYGYYSWRLAVNLTGYQSTISNRPMIRYDNLAADEALGIVDGLKQVHQGIELQVNYKLRRNIQLNLTGSLGDWRYNKDATAHLYDALKEETDVKELWLRNVKVANAPQFTLFAEAEWQPNYKWLFKINYYRADKLYAPFGPHDFDGLTDRHEFEQLQLPKYDLLGASISYRMKLRKSHSLSFSAGARNLLNHDYIERSQTNLPDPLQYSGNRVFYGPGLQWHAGLRYDF